MSGLSPFTSPQAWDVIVIGQITSPGVCTLSGFERKSDWDQKKGKGSLGATLTYTGRPAAKGSITFQLWTEDHYAAWSTFRPLLKYDPTRATITAVDIYHPSLADVEIKSVVVESIGRADHKGGGMYEIVVEMIEFFPPPKASAIGTPSGSTSAQKGTTPGKSTDPIADAQQAEIAKLLTQAQAP